jgi:dCTP deaminase
MASGALRIDPLTDAQVQPASVDLRLGPGLLAYQTSGGVVVDPETRFTLRTRPIPVSGRAGFVLRPGMFVLGCTAETVTLPAHLAAQIDGCSTLGRLGIIVHSTAGWVDPGFSGELTLELSNAGPVPVRLTAGMKIGQLCLFRCSSPALRPYGAPGLRSRYQGQRGAVAARVAVHA